MHKRCGVLELQNLYSKVKGGTLGVFVSAGWQVDSLV